MKSTYVEKEIQIFLNKIEKHPILKSCIKPIFINTITDKDKNVYYDVISGIKEKGEENPFYILYNTYGSIYPTEKETINYDAINTFIEQGLAIVKLVEYNIKLKSSLSHISLAIKNNLVYEEFSLPTHRKMEKIYFRRTLRDINNGKVNFHDVYLDKPSTLIYGEGGIGKTVTLQNFIYREINDSHLFFYLSTRDECFNYSLDKMDLKSILYSKFNSFFKEDRQYENIDVMNRGLNNIFDDDLNVSLNSQKKNNIFVVIDALDEISQIEQQKLFKAIKEFHEKYQYVYFIFTSRSVSNQEDISNIFGDLNILKMDNLDQEEQVAFYERFYKNYKEYFEDREKPNKNIFFDRLKKVSEDIKSNPRFLANLILLYFVKKEIPTKVFDILEQYYDNIFKSLEAEVELEQSSIKHLFKYKFRDILEYCSYQQSMGNKNSIPLLLEEYLRNNLKSNSHPDLYFKSMSMDIYYFFKRRRIFQNQDLIKQIYLDYFTACWFYNDSFKKNVRKGIEFSDNGQNNLVNNLKNTKDYETIDPTWSNFLLKLDYEAYRDDSITPMGKKHKDYKIYEFTLKEMKKNINLNVKLKIMDYLKSYNFNYNDFIKSIIKTS